MHIEVEPATQAAAVVHVPGAYLGVPDGGLWVGLKADMEEAGCGFKYALLHGSIRKIRSDRLRIKIKGFAAVLLVPIAAVAGLERRQPGLLFAGKSEHHLVFLHGALA
jgi:hypothetical protein